MKAPSPQAKKTRLLWTLFLALCAFALCASCARPAGVEGEKRVEVRGQYDVSIGHVHR
jgi:hypothetical protein